MGFYIPLFSSNFKPNRKKMKTTEETIDHALAHYFDGDGTAYFEQCHVECFMQEYADQFKPKWISVQNQLPELGKMVLVTTRKYDLILSASMVNDDGTLFGVKFGNGKYYELVSVTHWMPFPENPEL
jgi:hypothetical protein